MKARGWRGVLVADRKTPTDWVSPNFDFLQVQEQIKTWSGLSEAIPFDHYCRKNLGYLYAMKKGADVIIDMDDDNFPYSDFGENLSDQVSGRSFSEQRWLNVYRFFSDELIWPRGFALNQLDWKSPIAKSGAVRLKECPIQQYLADGDPDVDAIYRMIFKKPVFFRKDESPVILGPGSWCPFNSQGTVFFRPAFPLLYLPCFASFRMTDIWRSLIAQLSLHAYGKSVAYFPPGFLQERNPHNLVDDMRDEIPGYLNNDRIVEILRGTIDKKNSLVKNVEVSLEALVHKKLLPAKEVEIFKLWAEQLCD